MIASIDVEDAICVAAAANTRNLEKMARNKIAEHDRAADQLETALDRKIAASVGGPAALKIVNDYRAKRSELAGLKAADVAELADAMKTGLVIEELIGGQRGIRAGWNSLIGRTRPLRFLKEAAEVGARRYVNELSKIGGAADTETDR